MVAAGTSERMGSEDKIFSELLGRPLVSYSLTTLLQSGLVDEAILVVGSHNATKAKVLLREVSPEGSVRLCIGGERRQDSVRLGLELLPECDWIVIHDGARPCINAGLIRRGLDAAQHTGAAIPVIPISDTLKQVNDQRIVVTTINRNKFLATQTPQVFKRNLLVRAHQEITNNVTDDSVMLELLGYQVRTFDGEVANLKVTNPPDLTIAAALLRARSR